jgi:hypothetical protein
MICLTKLRRVLSGAPVAGLVVALAQLACACGPRDATPVPEPPALQADKLIAPTSVASITSTAIEITAEAGAASPGALVEFTNLDTTDLPVVTTVRADGSFSVRILPVGELRAVVIAGARRSKPLDFSFVGPAIVTTERPACLVVTPGLVTGARAGTTTRFTFTNSCSGPVTLSNVRTRLNPSQLTPELAASPSIAAGSSADISIALTANVAPTEDDVVFVDAAVEGVTVRYPLSVYVDE